MGKNIRILLVDDHSMFRKSVRQIIESRTDMEVVAEADNGVSAVKQVQQYKPDIVLMDIRMPVVDGINATRLIKAEFKGIKVIALSSHADGDYVKKMLEAGASDYLNKLCSRKELIECIDHVWLEGQTEKKPQ